MPVCKGCGKKFSWAKFDIKSGKVADPERCPSCQPTKGAEPDRVGKVEEVGKKKKGKDKRFKDSEVEVTKNEEAEEERPEWNL